MQCWVCFSHPGLSVIGLMRVRVCVWCVKFGVLFVSASSALFEAQRACSVNVDFCLLVSGGFACSVKKTNPLCGW